MVFTSAGGRGQSSYRSTTRTPQSAMELLESRRLLAIVPTSGLSAPGVDSGFGANGLVRVDAVDQDTAHSLVIQPDGKIVVAGYSGPRISDPGSAGSTLGTSITIIRLTGNGSLDETFGADGIVNIPFSAPDIYQYSPVSIARLEDGSLVVGGPGGIRDISSSGVVDTAFAGDGIADIAGFGQFVVALEIAPGGTIVAMDEHFVLARLNADGTPDNTFGASGVAAVPTALSSGGGLTSFQMYVQPDGKPVAIGDKRSGSNSNGALLRLNADGTPDTTFGGGDGVVITPGPVANYSFQAQSIAPAANGKIVVAGKGGEAQQVLARFLADGQLDSTFGGDGFVDYPDAGVDNAYDISIDEEDRIVVASDGDAVTVFRFLPDGSLDPAFPFGGRSTGFLPGVRRASQNTRALALQDDGKIVVLGEASLQNGGGEASVQDASDFYIYRLGAADPVDPNAPVALVGTRLEILGTASDDNITLEHVGDQLIVHRNGQDTSFDYVDVDSISINAFAGDDVISVPLPLSCGIAGDEGNNTITTGDGSDAISSGGGNDIINSGGGDDLIATGAGDDLVHAGAGNDTLTTGNGGDDQGAHTYLGEDGDDLIFGSAGKDTIMGGAGRDTLIGYSGADYLSGGGGKDKIAGLGGPDRIRGGAGDDQLDGGAGDDRVFGEAGDDKLFGNRGANLIIAGDGADRIFTVNDANQDTIDGGDGEDAAVVALIDELTGVEQPTRFA